MLRVRTIVAAGIALLAISAAPAAAAPTPQPYGINGFAGFRDVLPPGTNGLVNAVDLAQYEVNNSTRPAHNDDQRDMYANLVYGAPNVGEGDLSRYYKDGTFGVRPGDVASTTSPRDDVTILRDQQFGIPHVYGSTRAGAEFGLGYAARRGPSLLHRHPAPPRARRALVVRGRRSGNRDFDRSQWAIAPYNESDLQQQFDLGDDIYGAQGAQLQQDALNYVAGINQYINEASSTRSRCRPSTRRSAGRSGPDLEGHRPDRHRLARRRNLRQGRRRRSSQWRQLLQSVPARSSARRAAARSGATSARSTIPRRRRRSATAGASPTA